MPLGWCEAARVEKWTTTRNFTLVTRFIIKRGGRLANENRPARRVDVGILFINHVGRKSAAEPARTEHRVPRKSPVKCSLRSFFALRRKEWSFARVEKSKDGIRHVCFDCVILGRWGNKEKGGKVRKIKEKNLEFEQSFNWVQILQYNESNAISNNSMESQSESRTLYVSLETGPKRRKGFNDRNPCTVTNSREEAVADETNDSQSAVPNHSIFIARFEESNSYRWPFVPASTATVNGIQTKPLLSFDIFIRRWKED